MQPRCANWNGAVRALAALVMLAASACARRADPSSLAQPDPPSPLGASSPPGEGRRRSRLEARIQFWLH